MVLTKNSILESLRKVERWVEDHDYKAYEPFDGLSSPLRVLTFGNLFWDRILMQIVRQSPINLRPILGVKPLVSTKGRGYMAWGYLKMLSATGDMAYETKAVNCLEWLIQNKSPKFEEFSWANHFDFASRGGRYTKHESIIVWTSLIGQAFLDGYETLGDSKYLDVARSACKWIMKLPREETEAGKCLSYFAPGQSSIHNSNMLGAALLARTWKFTGDNDCLQVAKDAIEYSCSRQHQDGSWYYAEAPRFRWIDNFHTGYNLDSLKCFIESTGAGEYEENLKRGFEFYVNHFFEESGRPKYYHNRAYPIDSQCAAQAIETLASFSDYREDSVALSLKVASWWIENMQDPDGHFYYRQYPVGIKAKTPMLHWAQATMYKALSLLFSRIGK